LRRSDPQLIGCVLAEGLKVKDQPDDGDKQATQADQDFRQVEPVSAVFTDCANQNDDDPDQAAAQQDQENPP
jgi:hypothetical protein